jgi:hypothetical protein
MEWMEGWMDGFVLMLCLEKKKIQNPVCDENQFPMNHKPCARRTETMPKIYNFLI